MKKVILLLLIISQVNFAQNKNADKILERVKSNFDLIQDYIVNVRGKVNFPDAVIPEIQAKIYFKKPDKFKVESESFLILPRQAIRFGPDVLLKKDFSSILSGEIEIDNVKHFVIKVIPNSPDDEEIVTLWINSSNYTIKKMTGVSSKSGKLEAEFSYSLIDGKYWLPEKIQVNFEIKNLRLKRKLDKELKILDDSPKSGSIVLSYSNYIVNNGIDDRVFNEKER
ncbi:MAG: hypothetical protein ACPL25_00915 [Ignavibacteria bacterium]